MNKSFTQNAGWTMADLWLASGR